MPSSRARQRADCCSATAICRLFHKLGAGVDLPPRFSERLFEDAEASAPEIALTSDGNHPTHAGTFLAAVAIYGDLSHDEVANVAWRPFDMTEATAAKLKDIAARHLY